MARDGGWRWVLVGVVALGVLSACGRPLVCQYTERDGGCSTAPRLADGGVDPGCPGDWGQANQVVQVETTCTPVEKRCIYPGLGCNPETPCDALLTCQPASDGGTHWTRGY